MRDPNRIDKYCNKLATIWHKVPDWRFGQLMYNSLGYAYSKLGDVFFPEDEKMFETLEEYIKKYTE